MNFGSRCNLSFTLKRKLINSAFTPSFSQSQVIINKINQTKGLSDERAGSIVKEKNGFVWIGTKNGLSSFVEKDQTFRTNNKASGNSSPAETIAMAVRAQKMGMRIMMDFHYSETWTDPEKQAKPAAWAHHSFTELQNDVYKNT
jgi:hypothetical protein